jgi:hypothetical protein
MSPMPFGRGHIVMAQHWPLVCPRRFRLTPPLLLRLLQVIFSSQYPFTFLISLACSEFGSNPPHRQPGQPSLPMLPDSAADALPLPWAIRPPSSRLVDVVARWPVEPRTGAEQVVLTISSGVGACGSAGSLRTT